MMQLLFSHPIESSLLTLVAKAVEKLSTDAICNSIFRMLTLANWQAI